MTNQHALRPKRGLKPIVAIVALIVLASVAVAVAYLVANDSDDSSTPATTVPSGAVILPQNPSLRLLQVEEIWYVENDGNVTMSEVVIRDGSDSVVCEIGTLSPDDRATCEAAGTVEDVTAFGLGPQGQVVEVGSS